jgi:ubiquinone/menaquinone biosynthesis C-methylase UbiE
MLVSALEGHRLWAPHYDRCKNPLLALETRVLSERLWPVASRCFLDVACGTGRWMDYLCQRGARAFGVDLCAEMLAQAESKQRFRGRLVIGDILRLPFKSNFADVVLCSFAVGYFPHLDVAVAEMARTAKPGGRVIISDLHPAGVSAGWTRSFRLGADVYQMEHFAPSVDEICGAGERAGLQRYMRTEMCIGDPELPYFRAAGKENIYRQLCGRPAIWAGIWTKA